MGKGKETPSASAGRGPGAPVSSKSAVALSAETPTTPEKEGPCNSPESPSKRVKIDIGGSPFKQKLALANDDKTVVVVYMNDWDVSGKSYILHVLNLADAQVQDFKQDKQLLCAIGCYPFQPTFIKDAPPDYKVKCCIMPCIC